MMKDNAKRRVSMRLLALCLGTSAALVAPSAALGADLGTGGTVRATIGDNGAVKSVKQVGANGATSAFSGELPIKMSISHTGQTYAYHVENTFAKTQTVHFTDTAGNDRHTTVQLQLPLVAQLGVDVPASMTNLSATGATVTTGANGVRHVLWNMVLFSPLGTSAQDVSLTAGGSGTPVAELRATPVDPANAAGLSAKSQDKTAEFQQEDFWAGYASGGNGGLQQLADGTNKMVVGLGQLLSGLKTGVSGANQLADGSAKAHTGSVQLRDGLKKIHAGQGALTGGLTKIHTGQGSLTGGLKKIHDGQGALTNGLVQIHAGQGALTDGLVQINGGQTSLTNGLTLISGGLAQLNDPTTGLPAALAGVQLLIAGVGSDTASGTLLNGVAQLLAGIGDDATSGTLLNGVVLVQGGLAQLQTGIEQNAACAVDVLTLVKNGTPGVAPGADPCAPGGLPAMVALDPATSGAVVGGLITQFDAVATGSDATLNTAFGGLNGGLTQIHGGLAAMKLGLSTGSLATPGLKEGLQLTLGGLQQLQTGLGQAVAGIGQLAPGAAAALTGSQQLVAGSAAALTGSQQLYAGSGSALAGSQKLTSGSGAALAGSRLLLTGDAQALDGSGKLYKGSGKAYSGSVALASGLGQIADGNKQVADGLPPAVDGVQQLLDGGNQVHDGIVAVKTGATGPLQTQLEQASRNAHQQIAVLNAASALSSQAPGGAGTSYVLAQPGAIALAADTTASTGGSSHTGRNAALIAIGGVLALAIGLGAGIAMGRQRASA